jgi:hypothetical protein
MRSRQSGRIARAVTFGSGEETGGFEDFEVALGFPTVS